MSLILNNITKQYGNFTAVDQINLEVVQGSIFGLMGTNGAGKTTTIRLILGILKADKGDIFWQEKPLSAQGSGFFGYLPEERGLYPKMQVEEQLLYLANLHGKLSVKEIKQNIHFWLERLGMVKHKNKRIEQLSKGNQQKVQFIASIAHRPQVLILDEPFSGLDPVNAQLMQESFKYLHAQGVTMMISSHRLDQVEELCTQVALLHQSRIALHGDLKTIKQSQKNKVIRLSLNGSYDDITTMGGVSIKSKAVDFIDLNIDAQVDPQSILHAALNAGSVNKFEVKDPSLNDIYLSLVGA